MTAYEYRVLAGADEVRLRAVVDCDTSTVTYELRDGTRFTVDVVDARALDMVSSEAVYRDLAPTGPTLRLDRNNGHGWAVHLDEQTLP